jgi:hypothetical protein
MAYRCIESLVKRRDILMSYRYYKVDICARWKVKLRGWPRGVDFVAPGHIGKMHEIRILHEVLSSGECRWVPMSPLEISELASELKENPVVKTRKSRKRKAKENQDGEDGVESQAVARKKKKAAAKSRAVIEGDEGTGVVD